MGAGRKVEGAGDFGDDFFLDRLLRFAIRGHFLFAGDAGFEGAEAFVVDVNVERHGKAGAIEFQEHAQDGVPGGLAHGFAIAVTKQAAYLERGARSCGELNRHLNRIEEAAIAGQGMRGVDELILHVIIDPQLADLLELGGKLTNRFHRPAHRPLMQPGDSWGPFSGKLLLESRGCFTHGAAAIGEFGTGYRRSGGSVVPNRELGKQPFAGMFHAGRKPILRRIN